MADDELRANTRQHGGRRSNSPVGTKGYTGNPSGRPKDVGHVKELAKAHTEDAIHALAAMMNDGQVAAVARVRAAEVLLDRAWGKAVQPLSGDEDGPALRIVIDP